MKDVLENKKEELASSNPELEPQVWEGSSAYVDQGRHWSSALIWIICSLIGATIIWSFLARIDQTISVRGRLQPTGSVKRVESPSAGVISRVFVKDGQVVSTGEPLFDVEAKGLVSRRQAIISTLQILQLQANSIDDLLTTGGDPSRFPPLPLIPKVKDPVLLNQLLSARQQAQQLRSQLAQLSTRLASRRETLNLQERISKDIGFLYKSGGVARNQYLQQLNQIQETRSEVANLQQERERIIGQAAGQLTELNRQIIGLKSELVALRETLSYRTVRAPFNGKVFDLTIGQKAVVNSQQLVLKLVPANNLMAKVDISNVDIGFIQPGLPVTIAVDSFPVGEFGYIKGSLLSIGSDALPPDQAHPNWYFPATVSLDQQRVEFGNRKLNLQSGMSVSANIKLRSRPVITLVTDMFTKQMDGLKRFR